MDTDLRLTLLGGQIRISTNNSRIGEILAAAYAARHFAPRPGGEEVWFSCRTHGRAPWRVEFTTPDTAFHLRPSAGRPRRFDYFETVAGTVAPRGYVECHESEGELSQDTLLDFYASHFQRIFIEWMVQRTDSLRFVHAASLAADGAGILLLGNTQKGKTTLSLAGVLAGLKLLADDYSLVDVRTGALMPFPHALRLRKKSLSLLPGFRPQERGLAVEVLGETRYYLCSEHIRPDSAGVETPLTHIVILSGFAEHPRLSIVSRGSAAAECTYSDFFAGGKEALDLMWQWGDIVRRAVCLEMLAGPPGETIRMLADYVKLG